ncbi:hypothetical protein [Sphingobacterium sp. LRF_L2]|uniref:hypothetical protein n=1 Tax=Sphingobacterium sp. LRF_L2 TaxID=3369421 RepID=UPI003F642F22
MRRNTLYYLSMVIFVLACSKSEPKSYEYYNNLVNEKYEEINTLIQSVSCTNIDEFEIVRIQRYYLVHPSIRTVFDKLQTELAQLEKEKSIAYVREGWIGGDTSPTIPNHPVKKICENGKPRLLYVNDLSIEEIDAELPNRYEKIKTFYKDVSCTDANQWIGRYLVSANCNMEVVAIHETVQNEEVVAKIDLYNLMMIKKLRSEKQECIGSIYDKFFESKTVQCENGKPVVSSE